MCRGEYKLFKIMYSSENIDRIFVELYISKETGGRILII